MAAVAGALNVQLEKAGHYKLGKVGAPLIPETIDASLQLMQIAVVAWVIICFMVGVIRFVVAS
jgi:cobalamin biosynthesis protein CobD/CbiB